MKICSFLGNRLIIQTENSVSYNLEIRQPITIIHGDNATGKTLLVNLVKGIKKHRRINNIKSDDFNVETFSDEIDLDIFSKIRNSLVIIDRADMFLENRQDILDLILDTRSNNTYLIMSRVALNLGVSPNYYGSFVFDNGEIKIKYDFSEKGWF